ncbi:hypothetical protein TanjilG_20028 [Lupinus angustifolius]|uniref:Syringolide-induced protein 14-1-1 n=1 Tax=Lupinus angustifolius TaxID=3871 RepID=A0A4P1RCA5_LUPAN|nr:PREDICTED: uncharacterized protein At1g76070-like [Lupinus angustifolius]OIW07927.1 hypothetical protein TanjilG_20028 [Lupinus angustifolius]
MENKQNKLKNKILNIIPKAAAAISVSFQNSTFSPGRDHNTTKWYKSTTTKGFSGPMIPDEARRKPKDGGVETQEPTSPKISCMGQIKQKEIQIQKAKAKAKANTMSLPKSYSTRHPSGAADVGSDYSSTPKELDPEVIKKKHPPNMFQKMFFHAAKPKTGSRKKLSESSVSVIGKGTDLNKDVVSDRTPPMGDMRRFASGRETFANFDWTAQIAPEEMDHRDCLTDVEEEEDEVRVPFSEPILVSGGSGRYSDLNLQPRKEINIWKRRTMAPPKPLQLKPVLTAK